MVDHDRRRLLKLFGGTASIGVAGGLAGCISQFTGGGGSGTDTLTYGDTVSGELTQDDPEASEYNGHYDVYEFEGSADDAVTIELESPSGDTYLFLEGPNGETIAENDDTTLAVNVNSRIATTLPADGTYRIIATSYDDTATFEYELSLEEGIQTETGGGLGAGGGTGNTDVGGSGESIAIGDTVTGQLEESDPTGYDGRNTYVDFYSFEGSSDQDVTIEMTSETGDTYLYLEGPNDEIIDQNDDVGTNLNSQIATTLPANGTYRIAATSFGQTASFEYELSLSEGIQNGDGGAGAVGGTGETDVGGPGESIAIGDTATGQLEEGDPTGYDGRNTYVDFYSFEGSSDQDVTIEMTSAEGDTYLYLESPDDEIIAQNDDIELGTNLNSRIATTLPANGTYRIAATSFGVNATFEYELSLTEGINRTGGRNTDVGGSGESISYGDTVTGQLEESDVTGYAGRDSYVDFYSFDGSSDDDVVVDMDAEEGDTYLFLEDPGGNIIAENDDEGTNLNSLIETTLPADGTYRIATTSYAPATFEYQLSLTKSN